MRGRTTGLRDMRVWHWQNELFGSMLWLHSLRLTLFVAAKPVKVPSPTAPEGLPMSTFVVAGISWFWSVAFGVMVYIKRGLILLICQLVREYVACVCVVLGANKIKYSVLQIHRSSQLIAGGRHEARQMYSRKSCHQSDIPHHPLQLQNCRQHRWVLVTSDTARHGRGVHSTECSLLLLHFTWGIAKAKCILATAVCLSIRRRIPTLLLGMAEVCTLQSALCCCYISREAYPRQNVYWPRLSVCLSVRRRIPTLLHGPGCNLGEW